MALKCDRRWLLFFGCTYKAINSMSDLVHSWTVCKLLVSLALAKRESENAPSL